MKKVLFIGYVLMGFFIACGCNNAGGNSNDDTKTVKYHADSTKDTTKDSVKVKDTIKVIEKRKTGQ